MSDISNGATGDNTGGVTFEDLLFEYPQITYETNPLWAAIHLASPGGGGQERSHTPLYLRKIALQAFISSRAFNISMFDCLIEYAVDGNVGIGVILGDTVSGDAAKEIFITDCLFAAGKAPPGSTALLIQRERRSIR